MTSRLPQSMRSKIVIQLAPECPVPGPCWVWTGCLNSRRYGCVSVGGKVVLTHRATFTIYKGDIPDGFHVDHLCFNTKCCNPSHLDAVTPKVNAERSRPATKTRCANGHPLAGDNLQLKRRSSGGHQRQCRVCVIDRHRAQAEREIRGLRTPSPKWAAEREAKRAHLIASGEAALCSQERKTA
jgi:hypothetical protein